MRSLRRPVRYRGVEQMGESGTECCGAEGNEIAVEVAVLRSNDGGGNAGPRAAAGEAVCGACALWIVVTCNNDACDAGRRLARAEASCRERGGGDDRRHGGNDGEHGLDPLTDQQRGCAVQQNIGAGRRPDSVCTMMNLLSGHGER